MHMFRNLTSVLRKHGPYIVSAVLITVVILIVFGQDFQILVNEALQNEALNHILILPFFAEYFSIWKRDTIKASLDLNKYNTTKTKYLDQLIGVALILVRLPNLLVWILHLLPTWISHTLIANFHSRNNTDTLQPKNCAHTITTNSLSPFLVPIPTELIYSSANNGRHQHTNILHSTQNIQHAHRTVNSLRPPTLVLTNSLTGPSAFAVDLPCSGIYSLIAFAMFATFLLLIATATLLKKLALLATGFLVLKH